MTLQEIIDLGHTSVIAKVSGYKEVGASGGYHPLRTTRYIILNII